MIEKQILEKYGLKPRAYYKKKSAIIIDTKDHRLVLKKKSNNTSETFKYLKSRNYNYFPNRYDDFNDNYEIWEYQEDYKIPDEEKIKDLVNMLSLLHLKTTNYKKITEDDVTEKYENIKSQIEDLKEYYEYLHQRIEKDIYMSPSGYHLIRNISKIYALLIFCDENNDNWYELAKKELKEREVLIYNNVDLNHLITNERNYLISWDKAKKSSPIDELVALYKKYYNQYDFETLFKQYEHSYPLTQEEKILFFLLISLPEKIEFTEDEYENTKAVNTLLSYIYKTDAFISPYYNSKDQVKQK